VGGVSDVARALLMTTICSRLAVSLVVGDVTVSLAAGKTRPLRDADSSTDVTRMASGRSLDADSIGARP
jgi:hypothetical protein